MPERFGDWKNIHRRWSRWASDADNEYGMIDSTIVRSHQHSAGAIKKGQSSSTWQKSRRLSTKIHATVDALGNPTNFALTAGQEHDLEGADQLLTKMRQEIVIADKAYDAEERIITPLIKAGKTPVIPSKSNRTIKNSIKQGT